MEFKTMSLLLKGSMSYNHKSIRAFGLNNSECSICAFVYTHEGCSQEEASSGLRMDKTTLAKSVLTLEEKGILSRKQDKVDRRKKVLKITGKGNKICAEVMKFHSEWLNKVLSVLSPEEQNTFENYCARLAAKAEELAAQKENEAKNEA